MGGSITRVKNGRLQVYLADPLFHLQGSMEERNTALAIVLLTWRALGLRIAWSKGQRGKEVDWIGLWFSHDEERGQIIVRIPDGMVRGLKEEAKALRQLAMIPASRLRWFAGRLSWVYNSFKRLRRVVSRLRAAITTYGARRQLSSGANTNHQLPCHAATSSTLWRASG